MKNDFTYLYKQDEIIPTYDNFRAGYDRINENNWADVVRNFLAIIPRTVTSDFSKRMICGWLSALCDKTYYVVVHEKEGVSQNLFKEMLISLTQGHSLPEYLGQDGPVLCGKKQPSFIDSIAPTFERYEVMEFLSKKFSASKAIIIGGSMSYGPFYSVRGNPDTGEVSDIDGLVIIDDTFFDFEEKNNTDEIFSSEEIESFTKRLKIFKRLLSEGKADILSQRFSVKGKDFTVSLHFFPISIFTDITAGSIVRALSDGQDKEYLIKDFRTDPFTHPCLAQNSFIATRHESLVTGYAINEGYISYMPGYTVSKGILFPGAYHTVIYPAFLIFYDKDGAVTQCVKKFESFLYEEVQKQRQKYPFASYNKGHNRYDIFAPGRYEEGNNSFIHPQDLEKYLIPTNTQIPITRDYVQNEDQVKRTQKIPSTHKVQQKLIKWKNKTLASVEAEIKKFRLDTYSPLLLKSLRKDGKPWYTVSTVSSTRKEFMHLKKPLLYANTSRVLVSILEQESILPKDLLKLKEYNELAKVFGRVFVSASYDAADQEGRYPLYLSIIIRT